MSAPEPDLDEDLDWHRPHPITILVEIGSAFRSLLFAIILVRGGGGFFEFSALAEVLVIVSPLAGGLARWYTTRYALGSESVHHRHGLFRRQKQVLPRANVQNVSTKAGIISRLASVVELQISDASSSGDIKIRLIGQDEAERLTTLLRSSMPTVTPSTAPPPSDGSPVQPYGPPPIGTEPFPSGPFGPDGFGSGPLVDDATGSPATMPAPAQDPTGVPIKRPPLVRPSLKAIVVAEATAMSSLGAVITAVSIAITSVAVSTRVTIGVIPGLGRYGSIAVITAIPLLSAIAGTIARIPVLGGFRLDADPDRLRIQAGLLTETKVAARRERIQQIGVIRDLPHRWLGIERVRYETADVQLQTTAATRFLDPAGTTDGWLALSAAAIGETALAETDLQAVSPITVRRSIIRLLPLAAGPAVVGWLLHPIAAVLGVLGWVAFDVWFSRRRFAELGWARDGQHLLVRSGVFYGRLNLVRLDKVQSLRLYSSLLQRRFGLTTLSVSTAGIGFAGLVTIPDLPRTTGEALIDELAHRAARTPVEETL